MAKQASLKKILTVCYTFHPPSRGGELSTLERLEHLISRGYSCTLLHFRKYDASPLGRDKTFFYKGIKIVQSRDESKAFIRKIIERENPSIVCSYSFPAFKAVPLARKMGKKTILTAFSVREIYNSYSGRYSAYDRRSGTYKDPSWLLQQADSIIVSSAFVKNILEKLLKKNKKRPCVDIIHPIRKIESVKAKKSGRRYITYVLPAARKGAFVAASLAARLPEYRFLVVGGFSGKEKVNRYAFELIKQFKNITFIPYQKDIRKIFEKTKILLVPTQLEETFSRITWEAMANAIPVVASRIGNLPFLLRDSGCLCRPLDIKAWVKNIRTLMEDKDKYKEKSLLAYKASKKYSHKQEMDKFLRIVERLNRKI